MTVQILIIILMAAIALTILIKRFSGKRYGSLRPSMETTNSYLTFRVNSSMTYYLSGSDVYPNAIIGISKSWSLQSELWKPLEMDQKALKELVENMKTLGVGSGVIPYGYEIFDDREGKIGDWFSLPGQNITVWLRGDNRFGLSTPKNLYSQD
jgi:hypothetical protein